jgi:hypothetical protein
MFVADLCTPSIYLAYFICTLLGIKESYFNSTVTFPFIKVNSDQTSLQYKRIGCTQALKSLICPYMFILSDNKDFCMQNIALHVFFDSRSVAHRMIKFCPQLMAGQWVFNVHQILQN